MSSLLHLVDDRFELGPLRKQNFLVALLDLLGYFLFGCLHFRVFDFLFILLFLDFFFELRKLFFYFCQSVVVGTLRICAVSLGTLECFRLELELFLVVFKHATHFQSSREGDLCLCQGQDLWFLIELDHLFVHC